MPSRISLQRSCQGCIKAKRRCDLASPRCGRCISRGLSCSYHNEPLTAPKPVSKELDIPTVESQRVHELHRGWEFAKAWTEALPTPPSSPPEEDKSPLDKEDGIVSLLGPHTTQVLPFRRRDMAVSKGTPATGDTRLGFMRPSFYPMVLTLDDATTRYLLKTLRTFPSTYAEEGKSLFLHPALFRDMPVNGVVSKILALCRCATQLRSLGERRLVTRDLELRTAELIRFTERSMPGISGLLVALQALIMSQITLAMGVLSEGGTDPDTLRCRAKDFKVMADWSFRLWEQAPWVLPNAGSAKQSWLFAESVRRTLLTSHLLHDTFAVLYTGVFKFSGFISTLPYDSRTEIWDDIEDSTNDFDLDPLGNAVSQLISYRQLVNRFEEGKLTSRNVCPFERFLLVACRGYQMVANRLGMPSASWWPAEVD